MDPMKVYFLSKNGQFSIVMLVYQRVRHAICNNGYDSCIGLYLPWTMLTQVSFFGDSAWLRIHCYLTPLEPLSSQKSLGDSAGVPLQK